MPTVTVDFASTTGRIKPLHGVNNGPVGFGSLLDVSHRYREMGVPYVRLHDPNWPHPREVDVPQIFPDFAADANDPASYHFGPTDDYIRSILATGAKIIYRLGVSIEHYARKRYTDPPADFAQWSRIALGIVKHYTEGWADGLVNAVDYWEIWNEPDLGEKMWAGSFEQYLDLYAAAVTTIRQHNPTLKVGGFAAAFVNKETVPQFLSFCRDRRLPLDFFSWHNYATHPDEFVANARQVRGQLDAHGFTATESHLNEWNYLTLGWEHLFGTDEHTRREGFERQKNEVGASFAAATLIRMQDEPMQLMTYYDGQPLNWFCGLFDHYGVPQKTFFAFKAFSGIAVCASRVATSCDVAGVDVLAGRNDDGSGALLIANFGVHEGALSVQVNLPAGLTLSPEVFVVDQDHALTPIATGRSTGAASPMELNLVLRKHAVVLVRFRP